MEDSDQKTITELKLVNIPAIGDDFMRFLYNQQHQ